MSLSRIKERSHRRSQRICARKRASVIGKAIDRPANIRYLIARDSRLFPLRVIIVTTGVCACSQERGFRKSAPRTFIRANAALPFRIAVRRLRYVVRRVGVTCFPALKNLSPVLRTYVHMYIQTRSRRAACRCYKVREILGSGVTRFVLEPMLARASEFLRSDRVSYLRGVAESPDVLRHADNCTDCLKLTRASRAFS